MSSERLRAFCESVSSVRVSLKDAVGAADELHNTVGLVLRIVDSIEKVRVNKDDALRLAQRTGEYVRQITDVVRQQKADKSAWQPHVDALTHILTGIEKSSEKMAKKPWLVRWFHKKANKERIQRHLEELSNAEKEFQLIANLKVGTGHRAVHAQLEQRERLDIDALLKQLAPGTDAQWTTVDSRTRCSEGTRQDVISSVEEWLSSPTAAAGAPSERVFTLIGPAGFGKSAIARSVCEMLSRRGQLGASFFTASPEERRNPMVLVQSVARQLGQADLQSLGALIANVVKEHGHVVRMPLEEQVGLLLRGPFSQAPPRGNPLVVVVDGIDECMSRGDLDSTALLELLSEVVQNSSVDIRLFVTDAPRPRSPPCSRHPNLQEISDVIVTGDVGRFLGERFDSLRKSHFALRDANVGSEWPVIDQFRQLVGQTGYLFLYGATAMRYVESPHFYPPDRLTRLLGGVEPGAQADMDHLYLRILRSSVEALGPQERDVVCERMRKAMGGVVLLQGLLPLPAFARLVSAHVDLTRRDLESISAVIHVPRDTPEDNIRSFVRTYHRSFDQFVTHPQRCTDERFLVDPRTHHGILAESCLQLMSAKLKRNICNISNPSMPNSSIGGLEREKWADLLPQELRYACEHWVTHLRQARSIKSQVLIDFLWKTDSWVEVMSLLDLIPRVVWMLWEVAEWCKVVPELQVAQTHLEQMMNRVKDDPNVSVRALAIYELPLLPVPGIVQSLNAGDPSSVIVFPEPVLFPEPQVPVTEIMGSSSPAILEMPVPHVSVPEPVHSNSVVVFEEQGLSNPPSHSHQTMPDGALPPPDISSLGSFRGVLGLTGDQITVFGDNLASDDDGNMLQTTDADATNTLGQAMPQPLSNQLPEPSSLPFPTASPALSPTAGSPETPNPPQVPRSRHIVPPLGPVGYYPPEQSRNDQDGSLHSATYQDLTVLDAAQDGLGSHDSSSSQGSPQITAPSLASRSTTTSSSKPSMENIATLDYAPTIDDDGACASPVSIKGDSSQLLDSVDRSHKSEGINLDDHDRVLEYPDSQITLSASGQEEYVPALQQPTIDDNTTAVPSAQYVASSSLPLSEDSEMPSQGISMMDNALLPSAFHDSFIPKDQLETKSFPIAEDKPLTLITADRVEDSTVLTQDREASQSAWVEAEVDSASAPMLQNDLSNSFGDDIDFSDVLSKQANTLGNAPVAQDDPPDLHTKGTLISGSPSKAGSFVENPQLLQEHDNDPVHEASIPDMTSSHSSLVLGDPSVPDSPPVVKAGTAMALRTASIESIAPITGDHRAQESAQVEMENNQNSALIEQSALSSPPMEKMIPVHKPTRWDMTSTTTSQLCDDTSDLTNDDLSRIPADAPNGGIPTEDEYAQPISILTETPDYSQLSDGQRDGSIVAPMDESSSTSTPHQGKSISFPAVPNSQEATDLSTSNIVGLKLDRIDEAPHRLISSSRDSLASSSQEHPQSFHATSTEADLPNSHKLQTQLPVPSSQVQKIPFPAIRKDSGFSDCTKTPITTAHDKGSMPTVQNVTSRMPSRWSLMSTVSQLFIPRVGLVPDTDALDELDSPSIPGSFHLKRERNTATSLPSRGTPGP